MVKIIGVKLGFVCFDKQFCFMLRCVFVVKGFDFCCWFGVGGWGFFDWFDFVVGCCFWLLYCVWFIWYGCCWYYL